MEFRKAERKLAKLRLAIDGPSGSGKTLTSLLVARGLTDDWSKIAMIDTERGSGELYVGALVPGSADIIGDYNIAVLEPPFAPASYCHLIEAAAAAGVEVLIIDSLSHAWEGRGGVLDMHGVASKADRKGNTFTAWRNVTPHHNRLVDAIVGAPMHVIATMRTKTAYELEDAGDGKKKPVKIGMKPVQREGLEYEFTVVLDLSVDGHVATAGKDRTGLFDGSPHVPSIDTGLRLSRWLNSGKNPADEAREAIAAAQSSDACRIVAGAFKAQAIREGWAPALLDIYNARMREFGAEAPLVGPDPGDPTVRDATERRTQEIREKLQQATEVQEINGSLDAAEVIYEMGEADENAS